MFGMTSAYVSHMESKIIERFPCSFEHGNVSVNKYKMPNVAGILIVISKKNWWSDLLGAKKKCELLF